MTTLDAPAILRAFRARPAVQRHRALAIACRELLAIWERYADARGPMRYVESVVGTRQEIDRDLPRRALEEIDRQLMFGTADGTATAKAYWEPTIALHDDDVSFEPPALMAYYAIYNLHLVVFPQPSTSDDLEEVVLKQYASALDPLDADEVMRAWWRRVGDEPSS